MNADMSPHFVKGERGLVVNGRSAPWMVRTGLGLSPGDVVSVFKHSTGEMVMLRLVSKVPYSNPRYSEKHGCERWTFVSLDDNLEVDEQTKQHDAERAISDGYANADDGRPQWWSRRDDTGGVMWPAEGDIWLDRDSGLEVIVMRDRINKYRIGYRPAADDDPHTSGTWMPLDEFMWCMEFVSRVRKTKSVPSVTSAPRPVDVKRPRR